MRLNEWLDHKWRQYQYQKKRESSRFKTNKQDRSIILPIEELMEELDDMEAYIEKVIEKIEVYK